MEDGVRFGLLFWMGVAAVVGIVVAIEHRRRAIDPPSPGLRVAYLLVAAAVTGSEAETLRGFVLLVTAPIGAYKAARVMADYVLGLLAWPVRPIGRAPVDPR